MKKITRRSLEMFLAKHASSKKTLDIGSGGSSYGRFFPNRITVDIDEARNPLIVADARSLPFKDEEFEVVLCTEVLEHIPDPILAIKEMRRVLAPGGLVILTTRFIFPHHDVPGDYMRYTRYGLEYLFSDWKELHIETETSSIATLGVLLQRIVFQSDVFGGKFIKSILSLFAFLCTKLDWIILRSYGDIKRSTNVPELMTSGYYLTAKK